MSEPRLKCGACGYDNEVQRVYCHNCGAKLDRSSLPDEGGAESAKAVARRVRKVTKPDSGFFAGWKPALMKTVLWSAVVAGVVQVVRPPDDIPEVVPAEQMGDYVNLGDVLFTMRQSPVQRSVAFKEDAANRYLQNVIRPAKTGLVADEVKFHRAFVRFHDGTVEVGVHNSFFDYPLYASALYVLEVKDGAVVPTCRGGFLGRLPVHPEIMKHGDIIFRSLWEVLKTERKSMLEMASVEVKEGEVIATNKPAKVGETPQP